MFLEIVIAIGLGIGLGIITGLAPGIHINAVSVILVSLSGTLLHFPALYIGVVIVSMGITHTFLDTIPSIFLGAPDPEKALAVLPGHRLLLAGKGFEAVKLTIIGSLFSLIGCMFLVPIFLLLSPLLYTWIQPFIGIFLIFISFFMIIKEPSREQKIHGVVIFFLSGILGYLVLNFPSLHEPLFPLLSGLFGVSLLLVSLSEINVIPTQKITNKIWIGKKGLIKSISASVISGALAGFLPGLGSSQAAILALSLVREAGIYTFLIIVGGINTVNFVFSLVTFYAINKARNGAIVAMTKIIPQIPFPQLLLLLTVALIAGCIATIVTLQLTRVFMEMITRINYKACSIVIILFIVGMIWYSSSIMGIIVLGISTLLGVAGQLAGIKKSLMMGCLLVPVIIYFI